MCNKQAFRDPHPKPRTAAEIYEDWALKQEEQDYGNEKEPKPKKFLSDKFMEYMR